MRAVLIVDDSSYMRTRMIAELRGSSLAAADVIEAAGGTAALELLEERGPVDLVLVDLDMPDMDGVEFTAALKRLDADHGRVVLTASEWNEGARERALAAGVDACLTRPFTSVDLERAAA
ncbi:MAG: response regulator [bacterium]|nr:response regulator [bacterium]